jgi:hypothetical protein
VSLGGRTRIITLELAKLDHLLKKPTVEMSASEKRAFYFKYLTDREKRQKINEIIEQEEGIVMASEVLVTISRDEVECARMLSKLKYELDTQSSLTYARQEGEQKGRQERNLEILKRFESGYSAEQIKEQLKGDSSNPGVAVFRDLNPN